LTFVTQKKNFDPWTKKHLDELFYVCEKTGFYDLATRNLVIVKSNLTGDKIYLIDTENPRVCLKDDDGLSESDRIQQLKEMFASFCDQLNPTISPRFLRRYKDSQGSLGSPTVLLKDFWESVSTYHRRQQNIKENEMFELRKLRKKNKFVGDSSVAMSKMIEGRMTGEDVENTNKDEGNCGSSLIHTGRTASIGDSTDYDWSTATSSPLCGGGHYQELKTPNLLQSDINEDDIPLRSMDVDDLIVNVDIENVAVIEIPEKLDLQQIWNRKRSASGIKRSFSTSDVNNPK